MSGTIADNLAFIRKKIAQAALRAGRDPAEVRLVAVSKRVESDRVLEAARAGQHLFGENYLQEAREKIAACSSVSLEWHCIGHLQSNKAKEAARLFTVIHSVDRLKLATALDRHAGEAGKKLTVLVQVNVGGEQQKEGVTPLAARELLQRLKQLPNLAVAGLMTMPPWSPDPEEVRPFFRQLREMARHFAEEGLLCSPGRPELSMGMSGDFEVAVEEGATLVRVGTSLFGARQ